MRKKAPTATEVQDAIQQVYELAKRYVRENPSRSLIFWAAVEDGDRLVGGSLMVHLSVKEMAQYLENNADLEDIIVRALKLRYPKPGSDVKSDIAYV